MAILHRGPETIAIGGVNPLRALRATHSRARYHGRADEPVIEIEAFDNDEDRHVAVEVRKEDAQALAAFLLSWANGG
jgi:hypothetical protein